MLKNVMLPGASSTAPARTRALESGKLVVRSQPEFPFIQLNGRSVELLCGQGVAVGLDGHGDRRRLHPAIVYGQKRNAPWRAAQAMRVDVQTFPDGNTRLQYRGAHQPAP